MRSGVMSTPACRSFATRSTRKFSVKWPSSIYIHSALPSAPVSRPTVPLLFRSSPFTMTEIFTSVRRALAVAATIAIVSPPLSAQNTDSLPRPVDGAVALSLGDAARLAARQSAVAQGARLRADEAQARVRERRADLLPNVSAYANQSGHTFNTATFGIDFPAPPGQPPLFDPAGQV